MTKIRIAFGAIVLIPLVLCAGTGCSLAPDGPKIVSAEPGEAQSDSVPSSGNDRLKPLVGDELHAEYETAVANFPEPLPAGVAYLDHLGPEYEPVEGYFALEGMGKVVVAWTWLCSWEGEYIEAMSSGDDPAAEAALTMIAKWRTLPDADIYLADPNDDWTKIVLAPAKLGDASGVKTDLDNTCPNFPAVAAG